MRRRAIMKPFHSVYNCALSIICLAVLLQIDNASAQSYLTPRSERACTRRCRRALEDGALKLEDGNRKLCKFTCKFTGGNGYGGEAGCSVTNEAVAGPRRGRTGKINDVYLNQLGRDFAATDEDEFCEKPDQTYQIIFDDFVALINRTISCEGVPRKSPGEVAFSAAWVCMGLEFTGFDCSTLTDTQIRDVSTCYQPFSFSPVSFGIDGGLLDGYNEANGGTDDNFLDVVALVRPCREDIFAYAFQTVCT